VQEFDEKKSKKISTLAENVRFLVKRSGKSQKDYGEMMGCERKSFNGYLTGNTQFPIDVFMRIAKKEGVNPMDLYYTDLTANPPEAHPDAEVVREPDEAPAIYQAQNKSVEQLSEAVQRLTGMLANCMEEKERLRARVV
jgi:transcriptional regulator with XRE-family HTH domain